MKKITSYALWCFLFCSFSAIAQGSGKAYDFSSNYIDIPNDPSLNPGTITLEAWIKADTWAANIWENTIIGKDGWGSGEYGYSLRCGANGRLSFNFGDGTWHEATSPALMTAGNWYHVAGTYDGSMMRVYINGEEVGSTSYTGTMGASIYNINLGRIPFAVGGTRYFDGNIDEVRIWNTALSQATIKEYMCKKLALTHPQYLNLVGHWNMDAAGTVVDQSPAGNDGTTVGAVQVNSGAPIGDESVFVYGGSINLTLANGLIDSLQVVSATGLTGVHIYKVNSAPLGNTLANYIDSADQSHYFGVFATNTTTYSYNMTYYYGGNTFYNGTQTYGILASRVSGGVSPWVTAGATHNIPTNTYTQTLTARRELRLAYDCPGTSISPALAQNLCIGDSLTITDTGQASIRQWYDANGPISGATGNSITVSNTGSYYLIVNDLGCVLTSTPLSVTVHPNPVASFGSLGTSFCQDDPNQPLLNGTPSPGTYAGPGIIGGTSFNPSMTMVGTHTLTYSVTDAFGCQDADTLIVTVGAVPATPSITQNGTVLCASAGAGLTYEWYENGALIPGANANCYTATNNGNYTVKIITAEGCDATSNVYILDDLSIQEQAFDLKISLVPNPANDWLNISAADASASMAIHIFDETGRLVIEIAEKKVQHSIPVAQLKPGFYLVQISGENASTVRKIQIL